MLVGEGPGAAVALSAARGAALSCPHGHPVLCPALCCVSLSHVPSSQPCSIPAHSIPAACCLQLLPLLPSFLAESPELMSQLCPRLSGGLGMQPGLRDTQAALGRGNPAELCLLPKAQRMFVLLSWGSTLPSWVVGFCVCGWIPCSVGDLQHRLPVGKGLRALGVWLRVG